MRHHQHKPDFPFIHAPVEFDKNTDKALLQYCLGGTLYMPGTKHIVNKILTRDLQDLTSMVMCFEDAIAAEDLPRAEENVLRHLDTLATALAEGRLLVKDLPLIFLRVRSTDQFSSFADRLDSRRAQVLSGFVFPKFYSHNAGSYMKQLASLNERVGVSLYAMPILEGVSIAHRETRTQELGELKRLIEPYKQYILNVRVGGTDFSSIFGVRRGINSTIYDILTVRDCLADILNFFNRAGEGYTVSAPVWEYFLAYKQDNIDQLLTENIHRSLLNRNPIVNEAVDGLLREVLLDKANGFVGKTIIHPSHLRFVNAMQAVNREEYEDAMQILGTNGGVVKSAKSNKMNEIKPHRSWAIRISLRAKAYGVVEDDTAVLRLCAN